MIILYVRGGQTNARHHWHQMRRSLLFLGAFHEVKKLNSTWPVVVSNILYIHCATSFQYWCVTCLSASLNMWVSRSKMHFILSLETARKQKSLSTFALSYDTLCTPPDQ